MYVKVQYHSMRLFVSASVHGHGCMVMLGFREEENLWLQDDASAVCYSCAMAAPLMRGHERRSGKALSARRMCETHRLCVAGWHALLLTIQSHLHNCRHHMADRGTMHIHTICLKRLKERARIACFRNRDYHRR